MDNLDTDQRQLMPNVEREKAGVSPATKFATWLEGHEGEHYIKFADLRNIFDGNRSIYLPRESDDVVPIEVIACYGDLLNFYKLVADKGVPGNNFEGQPFNRAKHWLGTENQTSTFDIKSLPRTLELLLVHFNIEGLLPHLDASQQRQMIELLDKISNIPRFKNEERLLDISEGQSIDYRKRSKKEADKLSMILSYVERNSGRITGINETGATSNVFLVEDDTSAWAVKYFTSAYWDVRRHSGSPPTKTAELFAYALDSAEPYRLPIHPGYPGGEQNHLVIQQMKVHGPDYNPSDLDPRFANTITLDKYIRYHPDSAGEILRQMIQFYKDGYKSGISWGTDYKNDSFYILADQDPNAPPQLMVLDLGDMYSNFGVHEHDDVATLAHLFKQGDLNLHVSEEQVLKDLCDVLRLQLSWITTGGNLVSREEESLLSNGLFIQQEGTDIEQGGRANFARKNLELVRNFYERLSKENPDLYNLLCRIFVSSGFSSYREHYAKNQDRNHVSPPDSEDIIPGLLREILKDQPKPEKFQSIDDLSRNVESVFGKTDPDSLRDSFDNFSSEDDFVEFVFERANREKHPDVSDYYTTVLEWARTMRSGMNVSDIKDIKKWKKLFSIIGKVYYFDITSQPGAEAISSATPLIQVASRIARLKGRERHNKSDIYAARDVLGYLQEQVQIGTGKSN